MDPLKFYSRKDIQRELVRIAKNREVGVRYGQGGFGSRPDVLQFEGDVLNYAKKGATSFHFSEERWHDPMELKPGLNRKTMDELRAGWDLVLDIDCDFIEFSKLAAYFLIEAFKFHDVKNYSIKFSGRSGFHIAIPFESFPSKVNNQETKALFPDGPRMIAEYLKNMIQEPLATEMLSLNTINEIANTVKKSKEEVTVDNKFNPFSVLDIDSVLISSRHLFRAPYSFNEKSGWVSIPVDPNQIRKFDISMAQEDKVTTDIKFLDFKIEDPDASQLIMQAYDWASKLKKPIFEEEEKKDFKKEEIPKEAIKEDFFAPCIKQILEGLPTDGRKRAVFILINYLRHMGWSYDMIEKRLLKWNEKNYEQLRDNYILAQVSWSKRQNNLLLPPNCDNESYYKSIGVCCPGNFCNKVKNPVNQTKISLKALTQTKKKTSRSQKQKQPSDSPSDKNVNH